MVAIALSIFLGVGLASAAGFRIFLPLLALSFGAHFGVIPLNESFAWVGGYPAMIMLGIACVFEIGAYYIPWLDNALDSLAIPLAGIAGTAAVAATAADLSPLMTWSLAIIAGGGTAGAIKTATAGTRLTSSVTTAGIGNSVISTGETFMAGLLGVFAIFLPVIGFLIAVSVLIFLYVMYTKYVHKSNNENTDTQTLTE